MKRFGFTFLAMLLIASAASVFGQQGKSVIAVAANGNTASAAVGNQLGRSPFFLLFDNQGRLVEAATNANKDPGNAGIAAVDFLASKGTKVVVAETFGPKIVEVMKDKGMRPLEFRGSAQDAAKKALALK